MRGEELRAYEEALVAATWWNDQVKPGTRVRIKGLPRRIKYEPGATVGPAYVDGHSAVCRVRHAEVPGFKPACPLEHLTPTNIDKFDDFHGRRRAAVCEHRRTASFRAIEAFNRAAPEGTECRIYGEGGLSILTWIVRLRAFLSPHGPIVAVRCPQSQQSRTVDVLDVLIRDVSGGGMDWRRLAGFP